MISELPPEQRGVPDRRLGDLVWTGEPEFHFLGKEHRVIPAPVFMKEGLSLQGGEAEIVVGGAYGLLVRDNQGSSYFILPKKEIDWTVRPQVEIARAMIVGEGFLERNSGFDGLFAAGGMRGGKTKLLESLGYEAVRQEKTILFIRPKRAREKDGHQELIYNYPSLVNLVEVESVDEVMALAESPGVDLVIWDEMNLLIFAPSEKLDTQEEKTKAIAEAIETIIDKGSKFAGALLHRYATGQAFPPIEEVLELRERNPRTEIIGMHAQCICGAVADVQAMTEIYWWEGEFNTSKRCLVRPLVPIDEKREAIENFYGPLCERCHREIHGELTVPRWDELDLSNIRNFVSMDLF